MALKCLCLVLMEEMLMNILYQLDLMFLLHLIHKIFSSFTRHRATGISFNTDGTKMFIVGRVGDDVNEYTLSQDLMYQQHLTLDSFSVSAQDSEPRDLAFNLMAQKCLLLVITGDDVNEYILSLLV
jgi:hypothetical protein